MKYCKNCGAQLTDDSIFCTRCGVQAESNNNNNGTYANNAQYAPNTQTPTSDGTLTMLTKVFLILGCIATGFMIFPLCWTIPMTVTYFNAVKYRQPISTVFRVCTLLFVSLIGGILMLCDKDV